MFVLSGAKSWSRVFSLSGNCKFGASFENSFENDYLLRRRTVSLPYKLYYIAKNMNSTSEGSVKPMGSRPVANAPDISQISCLGGHDENQSRNTEPVPVHYSKGGDWYKDLSENNAPEHTQRTNFRETDSEFVRLSKQGGHKGLLKVSGCDESPFTDTKEISLKKDRMSPSHSLPAGVPHDNVNVAPGNPIWLGGSGPERGFVPGKRFMKQDNKGSPFAVSNDWDRTQGRNPDKI